jgi:hypothetical protein
MMDLIENKVSSEEKAIEELLFGKDILKTDKSSWEDEEDAIQVSLVYIINIDECVQC